MASSSKLNSQGGRPRPAEAASSSTAFPGSATISLHCDGGRRSASSSWGQCLDEEIHTRTKNIVLSMPCIFIWAGPAARSTHSKTTQAGTLSLLMLLRLALLVALTLVSLACCHCIYPRRDLRPLHMCTVSILRLRATSTGRKCGVGGGCCQSRLHAVLQQSGNMAWVQDLRVQN